MIDLEGVEHHPAIAEIVDVLCAKTQNSDSGFFKAEVAYFLAKIASTMRATIITKDRGDVPVNMYTLALATSGYGKGHSVNIMENEFIKSFKNRFIDNTLPIIADKNLWDIANKRAVINSTDQQEEYEKLQTEFERTGAYPFTFDSGTVPAVKQLRHKLLLANCGAISLSIDEIGSNLLSNIEILNAYLELYDQGYIKQKLIKNTKENIRAKEIDGKTPANMLLFGTPNKVFDGGQTEEQFYSFLEIGYARRCIFGFGKHIPHEHNGTNATDVYYKLIQPSNNNIIRKWSDVFHGLADPALFEWKMYVEDDVGIKLTEYKMACERVSRTIPDHEEVRKAELNHRYFKALKLAGALAFIDQSIDLTMQHLHQAILLVEESGSSFQTILNREKTYEKLAKYIASVETEVTHADLVETLPFYKSGAGARNELMNLAIAWGYKNNIIVKKNYIDSIEFFSGETLEKTSLDEIILSYSDDWAYNYLGEKAPFDQLKVLLTQDDMHWSSHHFKNQHRAKENVIQNFNTVVLDIDGTARLSVVHELLKKYEFITYTTKRHTNEENRFRLIMPINYVLSLDNSEYKELMKNLASWLPFGVDESTFQREKKWRTYSSTSYYHNEGEMLDVLPFIPKTRKNEIYIKNFKKIESMSNLERWFALRISDGNRNNEMLKYAYALVDEGLSLMDVEKAVYALNDKLHDSLETDEIDSTIMISVAKKY